MKAKNSFQFGHGFWRFGVREMLLLITAIGAILGITVSYHRENPEKRNIRRLFKAAAAGDVQGVSAAIAAGVPINSLDFDATGETALCYAVTNKNLSVVGLLLKAGANPNDGRPLDIAVRVNDVVIAKRLLDGGASPRYQGSTAVSDCISLGRVEMMELLLAWRTGSRAEATPTESPFRFSASDLRAAMKANQADEIESRMVRLLLDHGADFGDLVDRAVESSDKQLLDELLRYGVPHNVREAASLNRLEEVKRFVTEDPAILHKRYGTNGQITVLGIALKRGYREMAIYLLDAGAPIDGVHDDTENTALILAAVRSDTELVKLFIARGLDVNAKNSLGNTPLICAVGSANPETVAVLIEAGADVNSRGYSQTTPLLGAVRRGNAQIVQMLLAAGADPSLTDAQGDTALDLATKLKLRELVEILARISHDQRKPDAQAKE